MREIKFRAWNTILCRYSYFTLPQLVEIAAKDLIQWHILIIEQYTGLKDRNGVEIYERDVVEHNGRRFEIKFTEKLGYIAIQLDNPTNFRDASWMSGVKKYLTIIGNIHTKTDSNVQP